MTTPSPNDQLLAITREMLAAAQASDWDKLAELEKSRRPLFLQVFEVIAAGNQEVAREVLLMDENTRRLAEATMPILQQEILKKQNSGKANRAYQAIQNSVSGIDL